MMSICAELYENVFAKRYIRKYAKDACQSTELWSCSVAIHQDINHTLIYMNSPACVSSNKATFNIIIIIITSVMSQVLLQNRFRLECFNLCWFVSPVAVAMTKLTTAIGTPRVYGVFHCYHGNMGVSNSNLKKKNGFNF